MQKDSQQRTDTAQHVVSVFNTQTKSFQRTYLKPIDTPAQLIRIEIVQATLPAAINTGDLKMSAVISTVENIAEVVNRMPSVSMAKLWGPDNTPTHHFGLFRDDNFECIGNAVRKNYVPHTIDDVVALTEAAIHTWGNLDCRVSTHFDNGHYVVVAPSKKYQREAFQRGDYVHPRFVVRAGYDGKAFKATLATYVHKCSNLVLISAQDSYSVSIRHSSKLRERMPELIDQFSTLGASWESMVAEIAAMQQRELDVATFLRQVFPLPSTPTSRIVNNYDARIRSIVNRIARERNQVGKAIGNLEKATAWKLYNGVQGYYQHDARRRGNPELLERALSTFRQAEVSTALQLALAT